MVFGYFYYIITYLLTECKVYIIDLTVRLQSLTGTWRNGQTSDNYTDQITVCSTKYSNGRPICVIGDFPSFFKETGGLYSKYTYGL